MNSGETQTDRQSPPPPWGMIVILALPVALLFPSSFFLEAGPCAVVVFRSSDLTSLFVGGTLVLAIALATVFGWISLLKSRFKHKLIGLALGIPIATINAIFSTLLLLALLGAIAGLL